MDQKSIQDLSSTGHHQECLKACQQLLQSEPQNFTAWKLAGKSLVYLGQLDKAQRCLTYAHRLDTTDPEIINDVGNIFLNQGNRHDAARCFEKALEIDQNYAPAINGLAHIKRLSGCNKEAVDLYKQAIQIDSNLLQAYIGAATSCLTLGDFTQAKSIALKGLNIDRNLPAVNEILGFISKSNGNLEEAIEYYRCELIINPKSYSSLLTYGQLLLNKGQSADAIQSLVRAAKINPNEECLILLAKAYQHLNQFEKAIAEYRRLDLYKIHDKMLPFNLGLCLLSIGNNIDAIKAFKIAVEIDDSFIPAWGNIGNALRSEGRYQEAITVLQRVISLDPCMPDSYLNLGNLYRDLGNIDLALVSTLKSIDLNPDNPIAYMNLGLINRDLGNIDNALSYTIKSLELKPDNPIALNNLGIIYKDLGNLNQALDCTRKSLALTPDNPTALVNLGIIYNELGHIDRAFSSFVKSIESKPVNNNSAYDNLISLLQRPRNSHYSEPTNLIEEIDVELRKMKVPGFDDRIIHTRDIDKFIQKALIVAAPLENILTTCMTQVYHRTIKSEPNCPALMAFFKSYNSIAQKCHSCYKVQIEVGSLDELIILNLLMKTLSVEPDHTRKCMIELRNSSKGLYKGLIYCTSIDEAKSALTAIRRHIFERSYMKPIFTVKRGCTEFTNVYKEYAQIGNLGNLHPGVPQTKEWQTTEETHLGAKNIIKRADVMGSEFNLGEFLIYKNWILYALAMEDSAALAKYGNIRYENKLISKAIQNKKDHDQQHSHD